MHGICFIRAWVRLEVKVVIYLLLVLLGFTIKQFVLINVLIKVTSLFYRSRCFVNIKSRFDLISFSFWIPICLDNVRVVIESKNVVYHNLWPVNFDWACFCVFLFQFSLVLLTYHGSRQNFRCVFHLRSDCSNPWYTAFDWFIDLRWAGALIRWGLFIYSRFNFVNN